jgi:hypothetical protein
MTREGSGRAYQAMRRAQRAIQAQRRREREVAEDAVDRALIAQARAEGGDTVPLDEIARRYGL